MKFQTEPPPITSDRLRPSSLHALKSALWVLAFCKVWRPPGHANPIFNNAACSTWPAYIKKTEGERQWNGTIPPFPIALLKRSISLTSQGIRANTLISIIFPFRRHGRCLNDPFRCPGITGSSCKPLFSRTPFPPILGRRIMKLGRIQFC